MTPQSQLYLDRIGYLGTTAPTIHTLEALQVCHLKTVPFENLDIHFHVPIDFMNSFEKVVKRNRGGFCYELNYLFCGLLKQLGYTAILISARAFDKQKGYGPEFDHMAIIATINDHEYLADVGFGEFAFHPLKVEIDKEITDPRGVFRLRDFDNGYLAVEKKNRDGDFVPEYIFTKKERQPEEFADMCHYHQTSSESHFTRKRLCSLPTDEGRITLTGNTLKISTQDDIFEKEIENEAGVDKILWDYFKIKIIKT